MAALPGCSRAISAGRCRSRRGAAHRRLYAEPAAEGAVLADAGCSFAARVDDATLAIGDFNTCRAYVDEPGAIDATAHFMDSMECDRLPRSVAASLSGWAGVFLVQPPRQRLPHRPCVPVTKPRGARRRDPLFARGAAGGTVGSFGAAARSPGSIAPDLCSDRVMSQHAILLDLDGTLIDSRPASRRAARRRCARLVIRPIRRSTSRR